MRPPSFSLTLHALLTLPYRLCNPPPAAGNVRSCKVTPLIKISLDDVLNKRHLPPLTLKDFEEWLIFVEGCPQYLYFLLWFKEYETRYATWLAESGYEFPTMPSPSKSASISTFGSLTDTTMDSSYSYTNLIPPSAALALFFTRAKQTFLEPAPHAPYPLGPDALAALAAAHAPSTHSLGDSIPKFTVLPADAEVSALPPALVSHPHPHPRELAPLAHYARTALKERLEHFASSACQNVGTRRAWCGIAGGAVMAIVLGIIPALVALFWARARWWRIVGWLGCWIGGTIVISSFHGICMMIYVFGDLRQLRSFELARPAISSPRAIARARPRLRSLVTRTPDASAESTESKGESARTSPVPTPASDAAYRQQERVPQVYTPPIPHALRKKSDLTWSSNFETSTGTPVVCFEAGTFPLDTTSEDITLDVDIDISTGSDSGGHGQIVPVEDKEEDFGIEISPAYYPEGMSPTDQATRELSQAGVKRQASVRSGLNSVRSGVGRVFTRVLHGAHLGANGDAGAWSHAGTFGVRSWHRGLSGAAEGCDVEKSVMSDEAEEEEESMLTAGFIPHEYPIADEKDEGVEKDKCASPVQFDFDKLPALSARATPVAVSRPASIIEPPRARTQPSQGSQMHSPVELQRHTFPKSSTRPSPTTHLAPPQPALYSHPGARLLPIPAPSPHALPVQQSLHPKYKERQWWDTCPRHPAVEATFMSRSTTVPNFAPIPVPSTPRESPHASSDVHSRVRSPERGGDSSWGVRFRRVMAVPAFGPLTRVLSPIVSRGQWEIVTRSAIVAAICSWSLIGFIIALPQIH